MWLDRLGLTDIFHAWWFLLLLSLFCVCLIFVSVDHWPNVWKVYSKPVRFAEPHFRASLPRTLKIAVTNEAGALSVAERVLRRLRLQAGTGDGKRRNRHICREAAFFRSCRLPGPPEPALYFCRIHRGWHCGYRGNIRSRRDRRSARSPLRDDSGGQSKKTLPFLIRCDGAGEETYADGSPKKWWSKLALIEGGKEVSRQDDRGQRSLCVQGNSHLSGEHGTVQHAQDAYLRGNANQRGRSDNGRRSSIDGKAALADGESLSVCAGFPITTCRITRSTISPTNRRIRRSSLA